MQVVRESGVGYYVGDLAAGRAEETRVAGESPGVWVGGGSGVLDQRGEVDPVVFHQVLAGRDPLDDRPLRASRGDRSVAGVDLVFCAPKSVSVLHLLAPRELADAAGAAHQAAVADAVGYIERVAHGVRRRQAGVAHRVAATGVVAAGFVHRTSRALDPHLHTHLVMANVAQGVEGTWSATDTRRLFLHRRAIGSVYEASLRHELTSRTGIAWEPVTTTRANTVITSGRVPSIRWDVAGIDPVLLRLFSQRAASIDEFVHRRGGGRPSAGLRRTAFHIDRPDKDQGQTVDGLRSAWKSRAADFGIDPADLIRLVGRVRDAPPHAAVDNDLLAARLEHLATKRSWLAGRDVVAAVADASPSGLPAPVVERVAHTLGTAVAEHDGRALAQLTQLTHLAQSPQPTLSRVSAQEPRWVAADVVRTVRSQFDPLVSSLDRIGGDSAVAERARAPVPRADRTHERAERARWDRLGPRTLDR